VRFTLNTFREGSREGKLKYVHLISVIRKTQFLRYYTNRRNKNRSFRDTQSFHDKTQFDHVTIVG
jgi:hypothetical protein